MTAIIVKSPKPVDAYGKPDEGMDASRLVIEPSKAPPWILPYCASCDAPVERFTVHVDRLTYFHMPIELECHGKSKAIRVSYIDILRASKEGGLLWVFTETANVTRRIHKP